MYLCNMDSNIGLITHGHPYVEIGGVKWATMNIGAKNPKDLGLYFAWGETKGYAINHGNTYIGHNFSEANYKFRDNDKYSSCDNPIELGLSDDAAHVLWRGGWRMPTDEDFLNLFKACKSITVVSDNNGGNVCFECIGNDPNKRLLFPIGGEAEGNYVMALNGNACYWGRVKNINTSFCELDSDMVVFNTRYLSGRAPYHHGLLIRPILDETIFKKK